MLNLDPFLNRDIIDPNELASEAPYADSFDHARERRIAIVSSSYPQTEEDAAGHFVRAEACGLTDHGRSVHVVASRPYAFDRGVVAHAVGAARLFRWPGALANLQSSPSLAALLPAFAVRAISTLWKIQPERVIAHWLFPSFFPIAYFGPSNAIIEVVCHGADVRLLLQMPLSMRTFFFRALAARASKIRLVAYALRSDLIAGCPNELREQIERLTVVIPPKVNVNEACMETSYDAMTSHPFVIVAGRLVELKQVHLAIDAMKHLPPSLQLLVLGDGPLRSSLEKHAQQVAEGRVHFLGQLPRKEALSILQHAKTLVHPSRLEAAPTVVLEARALGVPVVTTGAGDTRAWSLCDPGIVCTNATPESLAAAIRVLLTQELKTSLDTVGTSVSTS